MKQPYSLISKIKTPLPYRPGTHSNLVHIIIEYDDVELLKDVLALIKDTKHNKKLFTVNEPIEQTLQNVYTDYLTMPAVGHNQTKSFGDRAIHIAVRKASLKIIGEFVKLQFSTQKIFLKIRRKIQRKFFDNFDKIIKDKNKVKLILH